MHHKRTFMFLEQVILRHGADALCTNIKEIHEVLLKEPTKSCVNSLGVLVHARWQMPAAIGTRVLQLLLSSSSCSDTSA